MQEVTKIEEVREIVCAWKQDNQRVAFVPTMGNLHVGHLSLIDKAYEYADKVLVSIFVNPIQFMLGEDYATYPNTIEADREKLIERGAEALFLPSVDELFPQGQIEHVSVSVPYLQDLYCGEFRPGHFQGVATIVSKLFNIVMPDVAVFGGKDYQQLLVIKAMVNDLCYPIKIVETETTRETDGLACSSRNQYLTKEERQRAAKLYAVLSDMVDKIKSGETNYKTLEQDAVEHLKRMGFKPDYVAITNAANLAEPIEDKPKRILAAAWLGKARLIDNLAV